MTASTVPPDSIPAKETVIDAHEHTTALQVPIHVSLGHCIDITQGCTTMIKVVSLAMLMDGCFFQPSKAPTTTVNSQPYLWLTHPQLGCFLQPHNEARHTFQLGGLLQVPQR